MAKQNSEMASLEAKSEREGIRLHKIIAGAAGLPPKSDANESSARKPAR